MSLAPAVTVAQPPLVPPTISLVNSAVQVDEPDERWINGFQYSPEACTGGQIIGLHCAGAIDGDFSSSEKLIAAASAPITGTPYGLVAEDTCSTFSYQSRDYVARATRLLLAVESSQIAAELEAPSYEPNNIGLTNAPNLIDATNSGPLDPTVAIGALEAAFYQCDNTQIPTLHITPGVFEQILGVTGVGAMVEKIGNRFYTAMGSPIIVDRGYQGLAPGGLATPEGYVYIYATGPVQVRRGPIMVIPGEISEATLRRENQVTFRAERAAHASFNYNCCVVGLQVERVI